MKTKITGANPYGYDRYGFAWEHIVEGAKAHLDFGCYDGSFLASVAGKKVGKLTGVDINREAAAKAREKYPQLEIIHITHTVPLPFEDGRFSSITVLDVIEHVSEQHELLRELHRVLSEEGVIIITVPGKHVFSFLDLGNLKFRFRKVHRWYYCRRYSPEAYEARYVSHPDGLVGDISAAKQWHEHFSRRKLARMLSEAGFEVSLFDGTGFFGRIIIIAGILLGRFQGWQKVIRKLFQLDAKCFKSMNLYCRAGKAIRKSSDAIV